MSILNPSGLGPPTQAEVDERTGYAVAIQQFAQGLVDDPVVRDVFGRVGVDGELSPDEIADINERFGLDRHFVKNHINFFSLDQQAVIMSLARRIVAGEFVDGMSNESFDFVFDRVFAFGGDVKWQCRKKDVRIPFDDYYQIVREFHNWRQSTGITKKLDKEKRRRMREFDAADETFNEDDLNAEVYERLGAEDNRLFRKYGWISSAKVWGVSNGLLLDQKSIDDVDYIRNQASRYIIQPGDEGIEDE